MAQRQSKTISFTPEHADFLEKCVESGDYQSASEVVRAALRLLTDQEERRQAERERVRALIQEGIDQLDRGDTILADEVLRDWEARHRGKATRKPTTE